MDMHARSRAVLEHLIIPTTSSPNKMVQRKLFIGGLALYLIAFLDVTSHIQHLLDVNVEETEYLPMPEFEPAPKVCKVAVKNSKRYHYETLESIAWQLPEKYLALQDCDWYEFDFFNLQDASGRVESWAYYFLQSMQGQTKRVEGKPRTIGSLWLLETMRTPLIDYDLVVEASCYCRDAPALRKYVTLTCVFHEQCPEVENHPRAVWLSPHHEQYYLPTSLPQFDKKETLIEAATNSTSTICMVGGTLRRSWSLMRAFLDNYKQDNIHLLIVGKGPFPKDLRPHQSRITHTAPDDYMDFHYLVANNCSILTTLVTSQDQPDYFTHGEQKLTGAIPLILAYGQRSVVHEELAALYPLNVTTQTHTDDPSTFVQAMQDMVEQVVEGKK